MNCALTKRGGQIAIGRLERFLGDWEAAQGEMNLPALATPTGKKVAIVGGGPAGLTAAADLVKQGTRWSSLRRCTRWAGCFPTASRNFACQKRSSTAKWITCASWAWRCVTDFVIGKTRTVDSLLEEYDAVFIGTGAGLPWFMEMPGNNLNGVYSANEYLTRINLMKGYLYPQHHHPDQNTPARWRCWAAGTWPWTAPARRCAWARKSTILYRRSRSELPARLEEVENAEEEGVHFRFLTLPVRAIGDENFSVQGLECIRMELGEPDASGRRSPVPVPGSEFYPAL